MNHLSFFYKSSQRTEGEDEMLKTICKSKQKQPQTTVDS